MSSIEELREKVQRLKARHQTLKGRHETHEEEMEKIKVEIKEAGFKNYKQLKAAVEEAEANEEKYRAELEGLLATWQEE